MPVASFVIEGPCELEWRPYPDTWKKRHEPGALGVIVCKWCGELYQYAAVKAEVRTIEPKECAGVAED